MTQDLTRRRLLGLAGTAAAGASGFGLAACSGSSKPATAPTVAAPTKAAPTEVAPGADSPSGPPFVSRPDLTPPRIAVRRQGVPADPRYIFLNAPYSSPGQGGSIILDSHGQFVWFGPNTATHRRLNVSLQHYRGEPMLGWFQGLVVEGFGKGELVLADSSYKIRHTVRAHGPDLADFHEFVVTPQGTALITIYRPHAGVDLRAVGGPANGHLLSGVTQEIDIESGRLLFEWDSWDRTRAPVPLTETYQKFGVGDGGNGTEAAPYNYFHINSVCDAGDGSGDLLISARNTWAIYRVSRKTGRIIWRLNGKKSDFTMGQGSNFFWQHHVRPFPGGRMTIFDNGATPPEEKSSRALIVELDENARRATLKKAFVHPGKTYLAGAMGSAQLLPDGRMFVGWGTDPYFSEFAPDGTLLLDGAMIKGAPSYRAFAENWTGHPAERPAVAARHGSGGASVYASWNGATECRSWVVLAGKAPSSLSKVRKAAKAGFETAVAVRSKGPYFAVQALDAAGKVLASSSPVQVR